MLNFIPSTLHHPSFQHRRPLPRLALGFDTEAVEAGDALLLADATGRHVWTHSPQESLDFLSNRTYAETVNWFFGLDADVAFLLRGLPEASLVDLSNRKQVNILGHTLRYLAGLLTVDGICYWNAATFYARRKGLRAHAARFLQDNKLEGIRFPLHEVDRGRADVLAYCIKDAQLAGRLGQLVMNDLASIGVRPTSLNSCGAILKGMVSFAAPDPCGVTEEAQTYAGMAYHGGWNQVYRRGYFPKLYNYDINSAYPSVMAALPDITKGRWDYQRGEPPEVSVGFTLCAVHVARDAPLSIVQRETLRANKPPILHTPWGEWRSYLTLDEVRFVRAMPGITITPIDGWYFTPQGPQTHPFARAMALLYEARTKLPSGNKYLVKTIANALSGALAESHDGHTGVMCNPVLASLVTARTRVRVASIVAPYVDSIIAVMTDGWSMTRPMPAGALSGRMGGIKLDGEGPAIVASENCWTLDRAPEPLLIAPCRWRYKGEETVNLFHLFNDEPEAEDFTVPQRDIITVQAGIKAHRLEDIGRFREWTIPYPLNGLTRRAFPKAKAGDLLTQSFESRPLAVADCDAKFAGQSHAAILEDETTAVQ